MLNNIFLFSFLPEFFFSFAILFQLIFNSYFVTNYKFNFPLISKEIYIQVFFILFCLEILFFNSKIECTGIYGFFENNLTLYAFKAFFVFLSLLVFIPTWRGFLFERLNLFEYFILYFLFILSSLFLISAFDFFSVYALMEMQTLCGYVLITFKRKSIFSTEAGLKYFIVASFMSGFFLLGSSIIYFCLGTLDFQGIKSLLLLPLPESYGVLSNLILLGFIFIFLTFFVKLAAAPFHYGVIDAYDGAPLCTTTVLTTLSKIIYFLIITKILVVCGHEFKTILQELFFLIGVFSMIIGSFIGLNQRKVKRLLLYSSVAQVGLLLCCLGTFDSTSYINVFVYLVIYIITSIGLWTLLSLFYSSRQKVTQSVRLKSHSDTSLNLVSFSYLYLENKPITIVLVCFFLSLAGIPPLAGFGIKYIILKTLIGTEFYILPIVIVFITICSVYYYLRIVKVFMFEEISLEKKKDEDDSNAKKKDKNNKSKNLGSNLFWTKQTYDSMDYILIAFCLVFLSCIMLTNFYTHLLYLKPLFFL